MSDLGIAPGSGKRGIARLKAALGNSWAGLCTTLRTEIAFRQEMLLACFFIPCALIMDVTLMQHIMLVFSIVLVLIVELLNTAIERVVDRISFDRHELSKEAKDIGSAAVLIALIFAAFTWIAILFLWK
ncbi:MAG TPA: diacylglycerol kinase [Alphaproteobacteria bacterium]